jgi:dolichol-phosphate mannosyltransferase
MRTRTDESKSAEPAVIAEPNPPVALSLVVGVYNEEECISELHRRLIATLGVLRATAEIIYVDDGSVDASPEMLDRLEEADDRVHVIHLSRNFGHQIAITAGMEASLGQAVVVLDADLQDPPEVIPSLVEAWRAGSDVVHAVRAERKGESAFKRHTASLFYKLIRRWTDLEIQIDAGDFRLMDRAVVEAICAMPERFRFVRGMVAWVGFRQESVVYTRDERFAGTSKYPVRSMLRLAVTALTSFSFVPLQFASIIGFAISILAAISIPVIIILRVLGVHNLGGQTAVLIAILFFGGVQLTFLGILGEYMGRSYIEAKRRPLYVVRRAREERTGSERHRKSSDVGVSHHSLPEVTVRAERDS